MFISSRESAVLAGIVVDGRDCADAFYRCAAEIAGASYVGIRGKSGRLICCHFDNAFRDPVGPKRLDERRALAEPIERVGFNAYGLVGGLFQKV